MRSLQLVSALLALSTFTHALGAQGSQSDALADGLVAGDYLRLGGGVISPLRASGSLRDWTRGNAASVAWETWQEGSSGVGLVGFGVGADYSRLALNESQFNSDFTTLGTHPSSASASGATEFSITTGIRFRIPAPLIMPSLEVGFGYMDFSPSPVHFVAPSGTGTANQLRRRGAAFTFGGGLDKHVADRYALFAEALYSYGLTSLGHGIAAPGGTCVNTQCDPLQNTTFGVIRGGLRARLGR
jgi:hypothetical protein